MADLRELRHFFPEHVPPGHEGGHLGYLRVAKGRVPVEGGGEGGHQDEDARGDARERGGGQIC